MDRLKGILATLAGDMFALIAAWYLFYIAKFEFNWFDSAATVQPAALFVPAVVMAIYWLIIFSVFGLYKNLFMISRFDEMVRVGKITIVGTLILFFLLFIDQLNWNAQNIGEAKYYTITYWLTVFVSVSVVRFIVRTIQKYLTLKGYNLHKAIIVGTGPNAIQIYEDLMRNKIWGMDVVGFVDLDESTEHELPQKRLGVVSELKNVIDAHQVNDVIVALELENSRELVKVIDQTEKPNVSVKILPDFYQMIIGLNRTNQIFGLPLIDVLPDPMPQWERIVKRVFDIVAALILLIISAPVGLLLLALVPLTSKGGPVFSQERVGRFGKVFVMHKFRTMYQDAEARTGPMWAKENDPRITPLGNLLRKLRLDEIPQFWNVLKGDMSLVGPRPERPYFVNQFKKEIPLYTRRLRVRPGITGWAQVKWKYDETFEDVVEKTKYDLFYVENMSLKMDFKILLNTLSTVLTGKGQ